MSEPFLLVASLLSPVPISAPPPPLPLKPLANLWTRFESYKLVKLQPPSVAANHLWVENSQPEFSTSATKRLTTPDNQLRQPTPASGAQLYQQRMAALSAGRLHTRLSVDSFYPAWEKAQQQPSYLQWKQLLNQEAKALARGQGQNKLSILLGDSLSMWFPSRFLPNGQFWLNQGISGENTTQIRARLSDFANTQPDTIYVMAGINDLRQGAKDYTIINNIRSIIRDLKQNHPQAEIVLQSLIPTRNHTISNERIRHLNQRLLFIAQDEKVNYLNLFALFLDNQGQMHANLTTDGIHLSSQGYQVWQGAMRQTDSWLARKTFTSYQ